VLDLLSRHYTQQAKPLLGLRGLHFLLDVLQCLRNIGASVVWVLKAIFNASIDSLLNLSLLFAQEVEYDVDVDVVDGVLEFVETVLGKVDLVQVEVVLDHSF
jgi:hypothetical protein